MTSLVNDIWLQKKFGKFAQDLEDGINSAPAAIPAGLRKKLGRDAANELQQVLAGTLAMDGTIGQNGPKHLCRQIGVAAYNALDVYK